MKLSGLVVALLTSLAAKAPALILVDMQTNQVGAFETLQYKTGWVPLGGITIDMKNWAYAVDPNVPFLTGAYEILGRTVDRSKPILPRVGEKIRMVVRVPLYILDYATTGEKRRLDSPAAIGRPKTLSDQTGLYVQAGDILEVRAVDISPAHGEIKGLWVRLSPTRE